MRTLLLTSVVCLALSSCAALKTKGAPEGAPFICDSSAYIDEKSYELPNLTSLSQPAYDAWVDNLIKKYPSLKNAYHTLRGCAERSHPEIKPASA